MSSAIASSDFSTADFAQQSYGSARPYQVLHRYAPDHRDYLAYSARYDRPSTFLPEMYGVR